MSTFRVYVAAPSRSSGEKSWILLAKRREGRRLVFDHRQTSGTEDRAEAEVLAADHERYLNSGAILTVSDVIRYREERVRELKGAKAAEAFYYARKKLEPYLGAVRVEQLDRATLLRAQDELARVVPKPRTVNTYFRKAAASWRWLHKRGLVPTDWPKIDPLPEEDPDKRPFTDSEVMRVLAWLETYQGGRWFPIVALCAETGRRISEVCLLRGEDVDHEERTLRVRAKGGQVLMVPILSGAFASLPRVSPPELIFRRPLKAGGFGPASPGSVLGVVRRAAKAVGIADHRRVDTHSFRRYACGALTRAGVPLQTAMRITGHKTVRMFTHYQSQWVGEDLDEAMGRVDARRRRIAGSATTPATTATSGEATNPWAERDSNPRLLPCKGRKTPSLRLDAPPPSAVGAGRGCAAQRAPATPEEIVSRVAGLIDRDPEAMRELLLDPELRAQALSAIGDFYDLPRRPRFGGEAVG